MERHAPADAWKHAHESDHWALVTGVGVEDQQWRFVRTFQTRTAVDDWVRDYLRTNEYVVALVDLGTGLELVPVINWVPNECSWPTCCEPPAADGRQFLGGAMCSDHTAESYERDAAARDEIDQVRQCSR